MKTLKSGKIVVRVSEDKVDNYLKKGYEYCPKSEWKAKRKTLPKKGEDGLIEADETKSGTKRYYFYDTEKGTVILTKENGVKSGLRPAESGEINQL